MTDLDDPNAIPDEALADRAVAIAVAELAKLERGIRARDAALDVCAERIDDLLKEADRARARRTAWQRGAAEHAQAHQDAQEVLDAVAAERDKLIDRVADLKADLTSLRGAHVLMFRQFGEAIGCRDATPATVPLVAKTLRNALLALRELMRLDLREWATCHTDAWLYAILVGWEPAQFRALARRWKWSNETRDRVLELREAVAAITR